MFYFIFLKILLNFIDVILLIKLLLLTVDYSIFRGLQNLKLPASIEIIQTSIPAPGNVKTVKKRQGTKNSKHKLLQYEYEMRHDGNVLCKICGMMLQSRTHYYRHKYKVHVKSKTKIQAQIFQCFYCPSNRAFFKSKKGYSGHLWGKHGIMNPNIQRKKLQSSSR